MNKITVIAHVINIVPDPEDLAERLEVEDPPDSVYIDGYIGGNGPTLQSACDFMEEYGDSLKAPAGFVFVRREGSKEWELLPHKDRDQVIADATDEWNANGLETILPLASLIAMRLREHGL